MNDEKDLEQVIIENVPKDNVDDFTKFLKSLEFKSISNSHAGKNPDMYDVIFTSKQTVNIPKDGPERERIETILNMFGYVLAQKGTWKDKAYCAINIRRMEERQLRIDEPGFEYRSVKQVRSYGPPRYRWTDKLANLVKEK